MYTVIVESVGYAGLTSELDLQRDTLLDVMLTADVKMLGEVVVVAERTTIEQLIDKKVINVGKDLLSAGGDATSVLEQLAEIKVDPDGSIALRGSSNVRVLVNGKITSLEVAEVLRQIPAGQISKIEVITTPSAKYQANGLTGIINIITHKKIKAGFATVINSNINTFRSNGLSVNSSYGTSKLGVRLGLITNKYYSETDAILDRQGFSPFVQETDFSFDGRVNEVNGGVDWYVSGKETVSFNTSLIDNTHSLFRGSEINNGGAMFTQVNNAYHQHKTFDNNLTYRYNISGDKYLQVDTRISRNRNFIDNDFSDNTTIGDNTIDNTATIYDLAADYVTPLTKKVKLEAGYAFNRIDSDNDLMVFNNASQDKKVLTTNIETVHAIYFFSRIRTGKLDIQAGMRGELFNRNALVKTSDEAVNLKYRNLFPSLHFSYKSSDAMSWTVGYNRRTSRPSLDQVLTINYQDHPFNTEIGNPNLLPEFSNNVELTWQLNKKKFSVSTTLAYRNIENNIVYFAEAGDNDQIIGSYKNIPGGNSWVSDMLITLKLFKWMTNSINGNFIHQKFNAESTSFANETGRSFTLQFANEFTVNKTLTASVRFSFNAREISIYSEDQSYHQVQLGARQRVKLFGKDAAFGMRVSDVFNNLSYKNTTYGPGFSSSFYRRPVSRIVFLTFSLQLNNGKSLKKVEKRERQFINGSIG